MDGENTNQEKTALDLLKNRNPNLGQLLVTERAVYYLQILFQLIVFRREHELEPLHDDIYIKISPILELTEETYSEDRFRQDIQQLEDWNLLSRRIEKERLRGYKDVRRQKFRYRLSSEALSFLLWLEDRCREDEEPQEIDTRNLLIDSLGTIKELKRSLNRTSQTKIDSETARSMMYGLSRLNGLTLDINQSLGEFNSRLMLFSIGQYDAKKARGIINDLEQFLEQFINQVHKLRHEILKELETLRELKYQKRWERCVALMDEERRSASYLMRMRNTPHPKQELLRLDTFFAHDGQLDLLCRRVRASTRFVWKKLYTHLKELERRSHRLEDIRCRIDEMSRLEEPGVSTEFIQDLLTPAHMTGDMNFWDDFEKAKPPQFKIDDQKIRKKEVQYLDEKKKGSGKPVRSMEESRLLELKQWISSANLEADHPVSHGRFESVDDLRNILELARSGILSKGRRLKRIGYRVDTTEQRVSVNTDTTSLKFCDLVLREHDNG